MSRVLLSIGAVQFLIVLVTVGRAKALSALLGPAGFGVMSTIDQMVLTLVHLSALSLPFTALKFMSLRHSEGAEPFREAYASFLRALTVLAVAAALLATAILAWRPELFGRDLLPYRLPLQVAFLGAPALALSLLFVNTLAAAQRAAGAAGLNLAVTVALAAGAIIGVLAGGLPGLYIGIVGVGLLTTAGTVVFLRRSLGLRPAVGAGDLGRMLRRSPEIVSYSAYLYLVMTAYSLVLLATRYSVLSRLGEAEAGFLQALLSVALTMGAVLTPMSNLYLTPLVNRQMATPDKVIAANDFAAKILILFLLASLPVILFPRLTLTMLFTREFTVAAGMLFLFVVWQCIYQMVNVYQQLLIGLDDVPFVSIAACAGFGAAGLLLPVLVPRFGSGGGALALAVGMLGYGVAAVLRLKLRFGHGVPARLLLRIGYALAVISLPAWLFRGSAELTLSGVGARAGFFVTVLALLWLLLSPEEKGSARSGFGLLPARSRERP